MFCFYCLFELFSSDLCSKALSSITEMILLKWILVDCHRKSFVLVSGVLKLIYLLIDEKVKEQFHP